MAARLAGVAGTFATTIFLARWLSPATYGLFVTAQGLAVIVFALGAFGFDQLYLSGLIDLKELSGRLAQVAASTVAISVLLGLVLPGLVYVERVIFILLSLGFACELMRSPYLLEPQRALQIRLRATRELRYRLVTVMSLVLSAYLSRNILVAAATWASVSALLTATAFAGHGKRIPRASWPAGFVVELRQAAPFALSTGLYTIYFQADQALVGTIAGAQEAALYRAGYLAVFAAVLIPIVFNNEVLRPYLYVSELNRGEHLAGIFLLLTLLGGTLAALGVIFFGPTFIQFAFGERYASAKMLLFPLGLSLLPHYFNSWAGNVLVARGRVWLTSSLQGTLAAGTVLANVLLVPGLGALGAAYATAGSEAAGALGYLFLLRAAIARNREAAPGDA